MLGLAVSTWMSAAQSQPPFCQFTGPANPLPEVHLQNPLSLPNEVLWATILTPRREIKIEIETNADGKITCATPLRLPSSLLLRYAMSAIENSLADKAIPPAGSPRLIILPDPRPLPPRGHPRVIVVPDPYHPPPEALRDPALEKLTCGGENVDELLDVIRQLNRQLSAENVHKEIQCLSAATALQPNSFALQFLGSRVYTTATTSREIVGDERQEFLEKSLALAQSALVLDPRSVEAQDQLKAALHNLGKVDEEEKATQELTSENNPPAVQKWAYTDLVGIYDGRDDRRKALIAARKAEQIEEIINQLETTNEDDLTFSSIGMIGREDLAAREEEAGEYAQAVSDYEAARRFAKPGLYYDGVFFKLDMGLARSLRQATQSRDAGSICDRWRHKAQDNIHIIGGPDRGGGALDWGSSDVANATWEYSCGNFDKGVQDLFRISVSRLQKPSDKWGAGTAGIYVRGPLEGLESAFLSRGRSQLAREMRTILDSASRDQFVEALKKIELLKDSLGIPTP
jgi:tetratricopeptide (TPR) repeat protein